LPQFSEQSVSNAAVDDSSTLFDFFSIFFPEFMIKRCIVMPADTVSLFCHNRFIDVYCHMFITALEFMLHRSWEDF